MTLSERITKIEQRKEKKENKIASLEKEVELLKTEVKKSEDKAQNAYRNTFYANEKKIKTVKKAAIYLLIAATIISAVVIYITFPFGEATPPEPLNLFGETQGVAALVCVYIIQAIISGIGICFVSNIDTYIDNLWG